MQLTFMLSSICDIVLHCTSPLPPPPPALLPLQSGPRSASLRSRMCCSCRRTGERALTAAVLLLLWVQSRKGAWMTTRHRSGNIYLFCLTCMYLEEQCIYSYWWDICSNHWAPDIDDDDEWWYQDIIICQCQSLDEKDELWIRMNYDYLLWYTYT